MSALFKEKAKKGEAKLIEPSQFISAWILGTESLRSQELVEPIALEESRM